MSFPAWNWFEWTIVIGVMAFFTILVVGHPMWQDHVRIYRMHFDTRDGKQMSVDVCADNLGDAVEIIRIDYPGCTITRTEAV